MIAPDDELTVRREVDWPPDPAPREVPATRAVVTESLVARPVSRGPARARHAPCDTQATRVHPGASPREAPRRARAITALHLLGALGLGAALASGVALFVSASSRTPAFMRSASPEPAAARAGTHAAEKPAPAAPHTSARPAAAPAAPAIEWTASDAAAALARNEYDVALRAYRALAERHPQLPVYRVIADVLARKLVHRCGQGAPCRAFD